MSYMYGICYVPFFSKNRLSKVPSSNPFPPQKNAQIVNFKNRDLDLIRRIHLECGFYGFMIRFWICPQKTRNPDSHPKLNPHMASRPGFEPGHIAGRRALSEGLNGVVAFTVNG